MTGANNQPRAPPSPATGVPTTTPTRYPTHPLTGDAPGITAAKADRSPEPELAMANPDGLLAGHESLVIAE